MAKKQKLELTWIGKGEEPRLEPRILIEDQSKSYGDPTSQNMLIHGDNLLALKALEQDYSGEVKCIYIDPPYNTGSAFEYYDDGVEHSIWLSLMQARLEILYNLLSNDGVIFISISDDEAHYLKVLLDEIFGRNNFCGSIIWEKKRKPSFLNSQMGVVTEYILAFAKNKSLAPAFTAGNVSADETYPLYNAGNARSILVFPVGTVTFLRHKDGVYEPQDFPEKTSLVKLKQVLEIKSGKNANELMIEGEWRYGQKSINDQVNSGDYYVVKTLKFRPRRVFSNNDKVKKIHNLFSRAHFGMSTYEDATTESIALFGNNPFDYPKPEMLISTLLGAVVNKGDLVLDSFLGSGTTAAVAHKMGLRWIGIELGDHAYTHSAARLRQVVDGSDQGGISKNVEWQGGGGFRFYELAPSLLAKDSFGNWVISKEFDANMLAHAMAKQEGFTYQPSQTTYWKQGYSTEKDYIYTTSQYVSIEMLDAIHEGMQEGDSLLIACKAFDKACKDRHNNITIKKIPQILLGRCEYGKNDYSLNIVEAADEELVEEASE